MSTKSKEKFNREATKVKGFKRLCNSIKFSAEGLKYAYKYEQNILVHSLITIAIFAMGIFFKITTIEWLFCLLLIGMVIATELINTSIEAVVDLACPEIHPLAKIAKDTAAAAVLSFAVTSILIGVIIFLPKILLLIGIVI